MGQSRSPGPRLLLLTCSECLFDCVLLGHRVSDCPSVILPVAVLRAAGLEPCMWEKGKKKIDLVK